MYAVSALCLLICLPFFMHYKSVMRYRLAASYKTLGTLCAACLALTAALRLDEHCWICFAALLIHAAADYPRSCRLSVLPRDGEWEARRRIRDRSARSRSVL